MQKKEVLQDPGYDKESCCMFSAKTSKILKQAITDFNEFIYFLLKTSKMGTNYNVDSNTKSSNYCKIDLNP